MLFTRAAAVLSAAVSMVPLSLTAQDFEVIETIDRPLVTRNEPSRFSRDFFALRVAVGLLDTPQRTLATTKRSVEAAVNEYLRVNFTTR